jgi:hypothetical protein
MLKNPLKTSTSILPSRLPAGSDETLVASRPSNSAITVLIINGMNGSFWIHRPT